MEKDTRTAKRGRRLVLALLSVIALFTHCGPTSPDVLRSRPYSTTSSGPVHGQPSAEHAAPPAEERAPSKTPFEEITAANASASPGPLPTFRDAHIRVGAVGTTTTLRAGNGFVVMFPERGGTYVTPAVYGGLLVTGGPSRSRSVHAFDAQTGTPVWTVNLEDEGASTPSCADEVCAFTTESCSLYVLDAKTGEPLWGKWLADPLMSAPTISNGKVFATYPRVRGTGPRQASLAAFHPRTGKVLWDRRLDDDVISAPIAVGNELSVSTLNGSRFRFAAATGKPLGAVEGRDTWTGSRASPSANGAAYHVIRLVPRSAESRRLTLLDRTVVSRQNGDVVATGKASKRPLWTASVRASTAPIAAGGSVWVGTAEGQVVRLDRETGEVLRRVEIGSAVTAEPLIEGGWIYAPTVDGLAGVDTKDPSLTGWSHWGGSAQRSFVETVVGSSGSLAVASDR